MNQPNVERFLVVDLEATCDDQGTVSRHEMEIIEIGAVLVDARFEVLSEYQTFVRPVRHPTLTPFCRELTTIKQTDVDSAPGYGEVVKSFKAWLFQEERPTAFCSWGDYDKNQVEQDCQFHGVANPMPSPHLNVKKLFAERRGLKKKPGLGQALSNAGLTFDGTPHRGIDDARNIARLLPFIWNEKEP